MIWKVIASGKAFMDKCKEDNINAFAAQAAYFVILSIIPFLMLCCGMLQYTSISEEMVIQWVKEFMPTYISPAVISILDEVYHRSAGILSVAGIAAVWSAAKGIQNISAGLNKVNGLKENRNWLVLRFFAVIDTIIFMITMLTLLVLLVFGNSLKQILLRYVPVLDEIWTFLIHRRIFIVFGILILFLLIVYVALPDRKASIRSQLPGAVLSAIALYVFSFCLSIYVDYFNGFSMYGSLTTVTLVMLWLYFCMYIILVCGEINYFYNDSFSRWHKKQREYIQKRHRN